jgi:hypothetical protein
MLQAARNPALYLLNAGFMFGIFFGPEDGGDMFFRKSVDFQRSTWHCIPEDRGLHSHCCENLKT